MIKRGVCCIVLGLEPLKFKTMTYKSFSSQPRQEAVEKLGSIIEHNLEVTCAAIAYCGEHDLNYRLSSSIFPLLTYDKAAIAIRELPNLFRILGRIQNVRQASVIYPNVRLSLHPDQFNVLASENQEAVDRTIKELDFYAGFMDDIGCSKSYANPINIHMNYKGDQDWRLTTERFAKNLARLSESARSRLVLENDDKTAGWSVAKLYRFVYGQLKIPVTFDYLHHKCHPDGLSEKEAFLMSYETWGDTKPLFHYSESAPGQNNPRKHADTAEHTPDTYGKSIDLDYEFKLKEKSW